MACWWWTDPGQPCRRDCFREVSVLGQEAVPGVNRIGPGALGDVQHLGHVEVARGRGVTVECVGLVGGTHMGGVAVRVGVDGH